LKEPDKVVALSSKVALTQGDLAIRITGPSGEDVLRVGARSMELNQLLNTSGRLGQYFLEIVPDAAVGRWSVQVTSEIPPPLATADVVRLSALAASGIGMMCVGLGAVLFWRRRSGARWRWFWVGAAVWAVGVALKFAWAIPLNTPILGALGSATSRPVFLAVGSLYIGALTGVFEIGVTLLAALIWKKFAQDPSRAVAIGVGAGAFEAILLGAIVLPGVFVAILTAGPTREQVFAAVVSIGRTTPLFWLASPFERLITILFHTASRVLVLLGVARGRWFWPFLAGFALMTLVDAVAGYVHLTGLAGKTNLWFVELALTPIAVLSVPVIAWCLRRWPHVSAGHSTEG
jgi:uncharacterized membrane protein YhfC